VRREAIDEFNARLETALAATAWAAAGESWYNDGGRITKNCLGPTA